jgi:NTE family protein
LNDGQQVDFLLARIAGAYYGIKSFDELPTPFRAVAVDLRAGEKVVLDSGSFATALRATMSLPGVFPPVEREGRVLVDGGALDNVPADVVRTMNPTPSVVIAVDVGLALEEDVDYSMFGLIGRTVDAMMRASTRNALKSADMTLAVDVEGFGSLDWRRADELIARGYQAAETRRADLLKYRASDADWQAWVAGRESRRLRNVPPPTFLELDGVEAGDTPIVRRALARHLNVPVNTALLEEDLASLTGLDRYQSITWQMTTTSQGTGLLVHARPKTYAPPFLMLGLNIENTTSESFRVQLAGRYLAFDVLGAGSELRVEAGLGADPQIGASLYEPLRRTPLFARFRAAATRKTFNFVNEDTVIAQYREQRQGLDTDLGINLSRVSEASAGFEFAHVEDEIRAGDPSLPELSGKEVRFNLKWTMDQQDSPVIPSHGTRAIFRFSQTFTSPEAVGAERSNNNLTQAETAGSWFHTMNPKTRVFAVFAAGTSFSDTPLPTRQFTAGYPYLLDAFAVGEERGDHYAVLTLGGFRTVGRLPDFVGGPMYIGAWFQNGSVFDTNEDANLRSQLGFGFVADTLVGPVLLGTSVGFDGVWRVTFGVGRIFR